MKYKVGDRVKIQSLDWYNENKDANGDVLCFYGVHKFTKEMSKFCGETVTISMNLTGDGEYLIKEDDEIDWWTDEMIECIAEEKYQPKFNIGDVVYSKTWQHNVVIMEILPGGFYAVAELYGTGCTGWFKTHEDNLCKDIVKLGNPTYDNMVEGLVENKNNRLIETVVDTVRESNDRYRIVTDPRFDIEVDEGEYYAVRRKNEYPKTYEECCEVLGISSYFEPEIRNATTEECHKFTKLMRLKRCRDAYWKLYSEEMGLGKPWEPVYKSLEDNHYFTICTFNGKIECSATAHRNAILSFPTAEIRDAFYENFKELIEQCKELL